MDLRQISYFVALFEEGSVTRAAQRVHVVQPALSMQIAKLERELATLFPASRPGEDLDWRVRSPGGPRVLDVADLEALRDDLADRVEEIRRACEDFDREAHHINSWTQGRGELNALVRACVRARQMQIGAQAEAQRAQETWATTPGTPYPTGTDRTAGSAINRADQVCDDLAVGGRAG